MYYAAFVAYFPYINLHTKKLGCTDWVNQAFYRDKTIFIF